MRTALLPAGVKKQLAAIDLAFKSPFYTQEKRLEIFKAYVERAEEKHQETHEAIALHFNYVF